MIDVKQTLSEYGKLVQRGDMPSIPPEGENGETFTPPNNWEQQTIRQKIDKLREFYSPQKSRGFA